VDKFVITGGRRLSGKLEIAGSKNAVLPILAATLLAERGKSIIHNVPDLKDIDIFLEVLKHLGAKVERDSRDKILVIDAGDLNRSDAPYNLVRKMRASFLVLGPLLARFGRARVSLPGGCVLGPRPVDLHLLGFALLGAKIPEVKGYVVAEAKELHGATIHFDRPTHTGTENLMLAASLAKGKTTLVNAACDPEVVDLADCLNRMGARIVGAGTSQITITGVKRLRAVEYSPIPDRLEAGTYMMAVAIAGGRAELHYPGRGHLGIVMEKLSQMGVKIEVRRNWLTVRNSSRLRPVKVTTHPYPGFPTDLQSSIMALSTVAEGVSHIQERVFENRFSHVMELNRLGASVKMSGDEAIVTGVGRLRGTSVMASDIRAGAGLVLAGLAAEGQTEILRVYHIDRGYERMEAKLASLGAQIERRPQ
jgi:UDP-N-acetylglucosamine 1-carboxyvinyltransferase